MKNEPYGKERSEPSTNATVIDINRARAIACTRKDATKRKGDAELARPCPCKRERGSERREKEGEQKRERCFSFVS